MSDHKEGTPAKKKIQIVPGSARPQGYKQGQTGYGQDSGKRDSGASQQDDNDSEEGITYLNPEDCPRLPANINIDDFENYFLIPEFANVFSIERSLAGISIIIHKGEEGLNVVKVPYRLFSPEINGVTFPKFILNTSLFREELHDYIGLGDYYNQNELLYMIIHHRMQQYTRFKRAYTYMITKDIGNLVEYADYNPYNSYNSIQKSENSYAILNVYDATGGGDPSTGQNAYYIKQPIGERIRRPAFTSTQLTQLFKDLPILPGSESMASETGKFVVNDEAEIYRAAGFKLDPIARNIRTIFPIKPNIPARFKTHVVGDAFKAEAYDQPIFDEDVIPELPNGTDETLINAVCVFLPIENDGRFLCGEIESSERFSKNRVMKREIIKADFAIVAVKEGQEIVPKNGKVIIGIDSNEDEVSLFGFDSVRIISIERLGIGGSQKIVAECVKKIGSSRITSSTGIKGVTKPRFDLGTLTIQHAESGQEITIGVDLLVGSNSIKAKENTVFLAQAALSHQLGYAGPEYKTISSIDEELINKLKNKLGTCMFTDEHGRTYKVQAGIVPIRITEMSYMYKNAKNQSFMTQSAWYLSRNGYQNLADIIYDSQVSREDYEYISELTKIIHDSVGYYADKDGLPVYSYASIRQHFQLSDCKIETNPTVLHVSRLLDEEFNKGFYIHMPWVQEYIRMPSAKLINRFVSRIADGTYIYPRLLTVVSQIIETLLKRNSYNGGIDIGFLRRKNQSRTDKSIALVNKYIDLCTGVLHYRENLIRNLVYPKVFGCSMKQMVDVNVPNGVIVISDDHMYRRLAAQSEGYIDKHNYFYALAVRNPVLWKSQIQAVKIWDYDMFIDYLRYNSNVNTEKYLDIKYCKDLVILNPEDAIVQQSDVDGDLMPIFVPFGYEAQEIMSSFKTVHNTGFRGVDNITTNEIEWIEDYRKSEFDSNSVFDKLEDPACQYKLYNIHLDNDVNNIKSFAKYFASSIIAKGDVGIATSNLWSMQILLDVYKLLADEGSIQDSRGNPAVLSEKDYSLISYAYSRLVQDMVVRGIKHTESGSAEFKPFLLANIIGREYRQFTYKVFSQNIGIGEEATNKLFEVLSWGESYGFIKQISSFISFYNSGNIEKYTVEKQLEDMLLDTFYGSKLSMFFDIKNACDNAIQNGYSRVSSTTSIGNSASTFNIGKKKIQMQ